MSSEEKQLLESIGLEGRTLVDSLKNKKLVSRLVSAISSLGSGFSGCAKWQGLLLYRMCTNLNVNSDRHIPLITRFVVSSKIKNDGQLMAACTFCNSKRTDEIPDSQIPEFETACGVGVNFTEEQIAQNVKNYITTNKEQLLKERYSTPFGKISGGTIKKYMPMG